MKRFERTGALIRSPLLLWNILARGRYDFSYDLMEVSLRRMALRKRLNLLRSGLNLLRRRSMAWSWPLHMQIELVNYCTLRCPVCPTGSGALRRPPLAMPVKLLDRVLTETAPYLLTVSLWGWGESLLHPELREVLALFHRHDFVKFVSTNGQNLADSAVADALLEFPPTYLIVAIDGMTDDTNGRYRVGSDLASTLAGVREIARRKARAGLKFPILHMRNIVMSHNQHEVPELPGFARKHGFEMLTLRALSVVDQHEQPHCEMTSRDSRFQAYEFVGGKRKGRSDFLCMQPFWFPTVQSDGTVVCCDQDANAERPMGRMSGEVSFADVWFGEEASRVRRAIRDAAGKVGFCRQCPYHDHQYPACSFQRYDFAERL